jgi:hypothetical protein
LMSGEHPLLANGATGVQDMSPRDTSGAADMSGDGTMAMSSDAMTDAGNGQVGTRARPAKQGGGKRAALQGRGFGNIPPLSGLQQIVGLALGSPEFQRH